MITKVIERYKHIPLNYNILEFFDLAINIAITKLEIMNANNGRNLDEINEIDDITELLNNASLLYLNLTLNDIDSGVFDFRTMAEMDINKTRSIYYQRWGINTYDQIKNKIMQSDDLVYLDYTTCIDKELSNIILFTSVILSSERSEEYIKKKLEMFLLLIL